MVREIVTVRVRRVLAQRRCGVSFDLVHTDGVTLLELGKQAATAIDTALAGGDADDLDPSTRALVRVWQAANTQPR